MKLSDFKLGTKLGAAFFAVVVLTAGVGAFAVTQLGKINANTEEIATNWLHSSKTLGLIRATMNRFRHAESDHVMSVDDKDMAAIDKRFEDLKKTLADQQATYEPMVSPGDERQAYEQYKQHRDAFFATHEKLLPLSRGGEKTMEQAKAYFRGESQSAFNALAEDLGRLVERSTTRAPTSPTRQPEAPTRRHARGSSPSSPAPSSSLRCSLFGSLGSSPGRWRKPSARPKPSPPAI